MKAILIAILIAIATTGVSRVDASSTCGNYFTFTKKMNEAGFKKYFSFISSNNYFVEIWALNQAVIIISKKDEKFCVLDMGASSEVLT